MDEEGRFLIQGEPVTHQRTHEALLRGLYADEDGQICTRIGYEWSTVQVADAPLLVLGLGDTLRTADGGTEAESGPGGAAVPWLALSDGTAERLDPAGLWLEGQKLYARVRGGTLWARFVPTAAADLLVRALEGDESRPMARFGEAVVDLSVNKRPGPAARPGASKPAGSKE
jgi:hypothetical protein